MTETSYIWTGSSTGDAQNLNNDEFTDLFRKLTQLEREFLLPVVRHTQPGLWAENLHRSLEIVIRVGFESDVVVYPGTAIVDGKVYFLPQTREFDCDETGYYRLVIRKTFPAVDPNLGMPIGQTVKLEMLYDQNGLNGAPLPTREDGSVWDVTLAMFYNDGDTLSFYPLNQGYIASSPTSEYGNRVFPQAALNLLRRQGGSATDWSIAGRGGYAVPMARLEVGSFTVSANPQACTFAKAFSNKPIVILQPYAQGTAWSGNNHCVSAISASGFSARFDSISNLDFIHYLAIGPD